MARRTKRDVAKTVLQRYPKSQAEVLHIQVSKNTPAPFGKQRLINRWRTSPS